MCAIILEEWYGGTAQNFYRALFYAWDKQVWRVDENGYDTNLITANMLDSRGAEKISYEELIGYGFNISDTDLTPLEVARMKQKGIGA